MGIATTRETIQWETMRNGEILSNQTRKISSAWLVIPGDVDCLLGLVIHIDFVSFFSCVCVCVWLFLKLEFTCLNCVFLCKIYDYKDVFQNWYLPLRHFLLNWHWNIRRRLLLHSWRPWKWGAQRCIVGFSLADGFIDEGFILADGCIDSVITLFYSCVTFYAAFIGQ